MISHINIRAYVNTISSTAYTLLKMVDEKFAKTAGGGRSVWEHVVVAYSKCNAHDLTWRSGLAAKKAALQQAVRQKIPSCLVDVPVLALGGATLEPPPPASTHPEGDGFAELWAFLEAPPPLDCAELRR